ncbi:MAG: EpsG family protein, partial [Vagococcus fluvialis]
MYFYIGLLTFILLISTTFKLIEAILKKNLSNVYLPIIFFSLTVIAGLRGELVGADTYNYKLIFNNIGNYQLESIYFEKFPLYSFYNLIIYNLFQNFMFVKLLDAIIINGILFVIIKKLSRDIYFSTSL